MIYPPHSPPLSHQHTYIGNICFTFGTSVKYADKSAKLERLWKPDAVTSSTNLNMSPRYCLFSFDWPSFDFNHLDPGLALTSFLCCMMSGTRLSVSKEDGPVENSKIYKRMAMILNVVFYFFLFWNSSSIFKTKQNSQSLNVLKISTPIFFLCVFKSLLHRMTAANYRYAKNKMTCLPDFYFFVPGKIINFINLFA